MTVRVGITRSKVIVMNIFFITKGIKQMNSRYDHGENPGDKMCFFHIGHATEMLGDICGVNRIWIGIYRYTFCYWNTAMKSLPFIDDFPLQKKSKT